MLYVLIWVDMTLGAVHPVEVAYKTAFSAVVGSGIVSREHAGK